VTPRDTGPTRPVLALGLAGVLPFWLLAATAALKPEWNTLSGAVVAHYAALILSFLGGARWGLEIGNPHPSPVTVALAMLPTLAGWAVMVAAHADVPRQLLGLGLALLLAWAWDLRATGLPPWYRGFRSLLTLGAVGGLLAGAMGLAA
jgi:hypothetical protein